MISSCRFRKSNHKKKSQIMLEYLLVKSPLKIAGIWQLLFPFQSQVVKIKNISWPEVFCYDCYQGNLSVTSNFPGINLFKAERVWGKNHFPFAGYLLLQPLQLIQSFSSHILSEIIEKLWKGRKGGRRKKRFQFAGIP